jgi:hypothetical protein
MRLLKAKLEENSARRIRLGYRDTETPAPDIAEFVEGRLSSVPELARRSAHKLGRLRKQSFVCQGSKDEREDFDEKMHTSIPA